MSISQEYGGKEQQHNWYTNFEPNACYPRKLSCCMILSVHHLKDYIRILIRFFRYDFSFRRWIMVMAIFHTQILHLYFRYSRDIFKWIFSPRVFPKLAVSVTEADSWCRLQCSQESLVLRFSGVYSISSGSVSQQISDRSTGFFRVLKFLELLLGTRERKLQPGNWDMSRNAFRWQSCLLLVRTFGGVSLRKIRLNFILR